MSIKNIAAPVTSLVPPHIPTLYYTQRIRSELYADCAMNFVPAISPELEAISGTGKSPVFEVLSLKLLAWHHFEHHSSA
jgi:hypothetical protein